MKIAILGSGSLVWDWDDLRIVDDAWHKGGPSLPIELSRLSRNRGYLTYVIDERHTRRVPTRHAISEYGNLEDAMADWACREGCPAHSIGYAKAAERGLHRSRTPLWKDIQQWVRAKELDAAIWTNLPPGFRGPFTIDRALAFWKRLPPEKIEDATKYAREAPPEVDTDFRRRLNAEHLLTPTETSIQRP